MTTRNDVVGTFNNYADEQEKALADEKAAHAATKVTLQDTKSDLAALQNTYDAHMATHQTTPPPTPTPGPGRMGPPTGYKKKYGVDFTNIGTTLPANWVARTGKTNNGATFRAQNLSVVPGKGLVHVAERASVGAPIYSGAANGNVGVPQFRYMIWVARMSGFGPGSGCWPSLWERPQSGGSGQGEKDEMEGFAGHIGKEASYPRVFGGGWIITSSGTTYSLGQKVKDYDTIVTADKWNDTHVYESLQTKGKVQFWVDGRDAGSFTWTATEGSGQWTKQFDDAAALFYLRTDFQIGGGTQAGWGANAGDTHAGALSADKVGKFAEWVVESVEVWVP